MTKPMHQLRSMCMVRRSLPAERIVLQNVRHSVVRIVLTAGTVCSMTAVLWKTCAGRLRRQLITLYADEFRCPLAAGVYCPCDMGTDL